MVSTGLEELDQILGHGYPERSSVLLSGPPGIGKEAIAYSFVTSAPRGEFSLYVTRLASQDVIEDMHGFGMDASSVAWISKNGTGARCDLNDLAGLSFNIKETLKQNLGQRVRVVLDVCSSLLMLNPTEVVYRFISQLLGDIKQYDAVALATIDEGMHPRRWSQPWHNCSTVCWSSGCSNKV